MKEIVTRETLGAVTHTHTHTQVVLNNKKIGGEF